MNNSRKHFWCLPIGSRVSIICPGPKMKRHKQQFSFELVAGPEAVDTRRVDDRKTVEIIVPVEVKIESIEAHRNGINLINRRVIVFGIFNLTMDKRCGKALG